MVKLTNEVYLHLSCVEFILFSSTELNKFYIFRAQGGPAMQKSQLMLVGLKVIFVSDPVAQCH